MGWNVMLLAATVVLLLVADFLALHDLLEPHDMRDWLVLSATAIVLVYGLRVARAPSRPAG